MPLQTFNTNPDLRVQGDVPHKLTEAKKQFSNKKYVQPGCALTRDYYWKHI